MYFKKEKEQELLLYQCLEGEGIIFTVVKSIFLFLFLFYLANDIALSFLFNLLLFNPQKILMEKAIKERRKNSRIE